MKVGEEDLYPAPWDPVSGIRAVMENTRRSARPVPSYLELLENAQKYMKPPTGASFGDVGTKYRPLPSELTSLAPEAESGLSRALMPALRGVGRVLPGVNAALIGAGVGDYLGTKAYEHMPASMQDTIGGTINQAMQRFGGGVDDSSYLQSQAAPPVAPNVEKYTRMPPMTVQAPPSDVGGVGMDEGLVRRTRPVNKHFGSY